MRKEDKYRELLRLQEDSGLGVREFCSNQDIAPATFYYWRKKFNREKQPDSFIPLLIKPNGGLEPSSGPHGQIPGAGTSVELAYPNGVVLRLNNGVAISDLKALINMEG